MSQAELIEGPAGPLEIQLEMPRDVSCGIFAIICHPHPLHQGTMNNKVVVTIARALQKKGVTTVRFNYRGVGNSAGIYDHAQGEVEDCLAVAKWAQQQVPLQKLWLAGFSFGSYIAAKSATLLPAIQLITVAPSIENMPYEKLPPITCPWLVIQGEEDEVINAQAVYDFVAQAQHPPKLIRLPQVGHYFHGRLLDLERILQDELEYSSNSH